MPTTRRAPYKNNAVELRRARYAAERAIEPKDVKVTMRAKQAVYAEFRAHTKEVLDRLISIVRDKNASDSDAIAAGKEILSRGWGAVPQHHVIEALMQHEHVINMDAISAMPSDQLRSLEAALARLVEVRDPDVIEHESRWETPSTEQVQSVPAILAKDG
jgi:hypothetical protein